LATTKASPVETATSETSMKTTTAVETTTTTVAASAPAVAGCQSCVS